MNLCRVPNDGRLDSAYDSERDPGTGHAPCRETPHIFGGSRERFSTEQTCAASLSQLASKKTVVPRQKSPVLRIGIIKGVPATITYCDARALSALMIRGRR
jgi:hypothetical protein